MSNPSNGLVEQNFRSRAVIFPLARCSAMRFSPPPSRAAAPLFQLFDRGCHVGSRIVLHLACTVRPLVRSTQQLQSRSIGAALAECCSCNNAVNLR